MMHGKKRSRSDPSSISAPMQGDDDLDHHRPLNVRPRRLIYHDEPAMNDGKDGGTVRSSWLYPVSPISLGDRESPSPAAGRGDLREEIRALSRQLSQVKRLLGPATERCTEAVNSVSDGSLKTTDHIEFLEARRACNRFESLGEGRNGGLNSIFMNRSAIKLANIDALLDFELTPACGSQRRSSHFRFADLCGAPGGFSEYLLRRCREGGVPFASGYGMSLVGINEHGHGVEWKLDDMAFTENGVCSRYHVSTGADGTGDVFEWKNVEYLKQTIVSDSETDGGFYSQLVDLVVADGGFDAQRDSENQEDIAQKLVVCETSAALELLRIGGSFAIKLFGFQTSVVRTMLYELFEMFESLLMVKPVSSRPASAERYLICQGFKGTDNDWSGQRWQSRVFLGDFVAPTLPLDDRGRLDYYLDRFDRDLLALNLRTCYSILSNLERKSLIVSNPSRDDPPMVEVEALTNVNDYVNDYANEWRLA